MISEFSAIPAPAELLSGPDAPMRRFHKNKFPRLRMDPAVFRAAAGKDQRIKLSLVDHTELEIVIERRGRYWLPIDHALLPFAGRLRASV